MSKLKSRLVSVLVTAVVLLGLTGCPSKEEQTPAGEPTAEVQAQQTADQNMPTAEQPAPEHPGGEHPTSEHPK